jgi:hypothetical protein
VPPRLASSLDRSGHRIELHRVPYHLNRSDESRQDQGRGGRISHRGLDAIGADAASCSARSPSVDERRARHQTMRRSFRAPNVTAAPPAMVSRCAPKARIHRARAVTAARTARRWSTRRGSVALTPTAGCLASRDCTISVHWCTGCTLCTLCTLWELPILESAEEPPEADVF